MKKILVTAKRVTDPDMKIKVKGDGSGIEMGSMSFKLNPFDEIAIEEAIRIRETHGSDIEIVIVSIGSEASRVEMKTGLAMGANRGIIVPLAEGADSDGIARILVKIVDQEKPDLVLLGKQAVDVDDNQVAQLLATYLDWGQACFASKVEINGDTATVHREIDGGAEILEMKLPGVISVDLRLNEPRYPTVPDTMKANKKEIKIIPLEKLGVAVCPKVVVRRLLPPKQRQAGKMVKDVETLFELLKTEAKVI